jgi:hypothetical protein
VVQRDSVSVTVRDVKSRTQSMKHDSDRLQIVSVQVTTRHTDNPRVVLRQEVAQRFHVRLGGHRSIGRSISTLY